MGRLLHLYFDDSGTRNLGKGEIVRSDNLDYFALGGVLVFQEDAEKIVALHSKFCRSWGITYPLHSTKIRGRRKPFDWLGRDEAKNEKFLSELSSLVNQCPMKCIACVIDRPGYYTRYAGKYGKDAWDMSKTAYSILAERSAKYAIRHDAKLVVHFEESGKKEDNKVLEYAKLLKAQGMPFENADPKYKSLDSEKFSETILGDPNRSTKKNPMIQIADLVLFPVAKGGYDSNYKAYRFLVDNNKIVDSDLTEVEKPSQGVKYSCFDT